MNKKTIDGPDHNVPLPDEAEQLTSKIELETETPACFEAHIFLLLGFD